MRYRRAGQGLLFVAILLNCQLLKKILKVRGGITPEKCLTCLGARAKSKGSYMRRLCLPLKTYRLICAAICLFAMAALASHAETQRPPELEEIRITTPVYRPDFSEYTPKLGTYKYTVGWEGIPAAECSVSMERLEDGNYQIVAAARTYSFIDLFYKLRYHAEGLLSGTALMPIRSSTQETENSRVKRTEITFHPDGTIESVRQMKGKSPETLSFKPENFTLDPFAAAFIARGVDWKVGETRQFDTFNGKSRYLISLTATGLEKLRHDGVIRDVWVIVPKVKTVGKEGVERKLRSAKIYLSADSNREIIKIVSSVFIGSVRAELDSFVASTRQSSEPIRVAQSGPLKKSL